MSKKLEIPVGIRVFVDEQTANICLKMVEMHVNQEAVEVVAENRSDGSIEFMFRRKKRDT